MKITRDEAIKLLSQILPDFDIEIVDEFENETERHEDLPIIMPKVKPRHAEIVPPDEEDKLPVKARKQFFLDLYMGIALDKKITKLTEKVMFHFEDFMKHGQYLGNDWSLHQWQDFFFQLLKDDIAIEPRTAYYRPVDWLLKEVAELEFIPASEFKEGKQ